MRAYVTHHTVVHTIRSQFIIIQLKLIENCVQSFWYITQLHLLEKRIFQENEYRDDTVYVKVHHNISFPLYIYYYHKLHIARTTIYSHHNTQHQYQHQNIKLINDLRNEASHPLYIYIYNKPTFTVKCMESEYLKFLLLFSLV